MALTPRYRPGFADDLRRHNMQSRVEQAIRVVCEEPSLGKPLGRELRGLQSRRIGGFRLIYQCPVGREEVWFYALLPRDEVYERMLGRFGG